LLHVGMCSKSPASQVLLKGPREMEITRCKIGIVGTVLHNIPAITSKSVTSPVVRTGPGIIMQSNDTLVQQPSPFVINGLL
jgi:hypothetical protein